jgi:hypothetical protein
LLPSPPHPVATRHRCYSIPPPDARARIYTLVQLSPFGTSREKEREKHGREGQEASPGTGAGMVGTPTQGPSSSQQYPPARARMRRWDTTARRRSRGATLRHTRPTSPRPSPRRCRDPSHHVLIGATRGSPTTSSPWNRYARDARIVSTNLNSGLDCLLMRFHGFV